MKMVVICFGAMWPILINTADGARLVPTERLDTARIFGLSPIETLLRVIVPSATPMIAAGMRTGLSIAFIMIVVSEMIGSTDGLGYYILQAQRTFAIPEMYGGIGLLAILGYLTQRCSYRSSAGARLALRTNRPPGVVVKERSLHVEPERDPPRRQRAAKAVR